MKSYKFTVFGKNIGIYIILTKIFGISYIDKSINHLVPITQLVVGEESDTKRHSSKKGFKNEPVVDEFIDDSAVIFEPKRLEKGGREEVSQEMLVRHHRVWDQVGVVDHCNWSYTVTCLVFYWQHFVCFI